MVRNPFNPHQINQYALNPEAVDALCFCTKNPEPMIPRVKELRNFRQIWHVTITAYGKDVEPGVPAVERVVDSFKRLSDEVGVRCISWRYDPIFLSPTYTKQRHLETFSYIARSLRGYTESCIFSFIDLYRKTVRNFPEVKRVSHEEQQEMVRAMAEIGESEGMKLISCLENPEFAKLGVDTTGCLTKEKIEKAAGIRLRIPGRERGEVRKGCSCLLGHDIGAYNSCPHLCRYCYADYDGKEVMERIRLHNPYSSLLIGTPGEEDKITEVPVRSWIEREMNLFG